VVKKEKVVIGTTMSKEYEPYLEAFIQYCLQERKSQEHHYEIMPEIIIAINNADTSFVEKVAKTVQNAGFNTKILYCKKQFEDNYVAIAQSKNVVFATAYQQGADYLLLLDIDTIPVTNCVSNMLRLFKKYKRAVIVSGMYVRKIPNATGVVVSLRQEEEKKFYNPEIREFYVKAVGFGFMMVSRKFMQHYRCPEERPKGYLTEDFPLCMKIQEHGDKILFSKDLIAMHIQYNPDTRKFDIYVPDIQDIARNSCIQLSQ